MKRENIYQILNNLKLSQKILLLIALPIITIIIFSVNTIQNKLIEKIQ